jgi:hypothetical protein
MKTKYYLVIFFVFFYFNFSLTIAQQLNQILLYEVNNNHYPLDIILLLPGTDFNGYRIITKIHTGNENEFINKKVQIISNTINLEECYFESPFTRPDVGIDTFLIGTLEDIEYTLNANVYISYNIETCSKFDSTVVSLKFNKDGPVTSLKNQSDTHDKIIFPNPFNTYFLVRNIKLPSRIKIFDMMGNLIIEESVTSDRIVLNSLDKGIYLMELDRKLFKIIKQ